MKKIPLNQYFDTVKNHFFVMVSVFCVGMILIPKVMVSKIGSVIFSIITIIIYMLSMYYHAHAVATRDKKLHTNEKPFMAKGFFLPLGILIINILLFAIYIFAWTTMAENGVFTEIPGIVLNMMFTFWNFIYNGIFKISTGNILWYGYIFIAAIPFIATGLGYIAGMKNFDLNSKINKLINVCKR